MNGLTALAEAGGFRVNRVSPEARRTWEHSAAENGIPLALSDLDQWRLMGLGPDSIFCTIHDSQSALMGGFAVQRYPSRALPGHRFLRLERVGEAIPPGAEPAVVGALLRLVRETPRTLRAVVEIHDRDPSRRQRLVRAAQEAGFHRKEPVRTYQRTVSINLQRGDEELFSSFSTRARRAIRRAERLSLCVEPVEDETLLPQLERIHRETFVRTGAQPPAQPWERVLTAAREAPHTVRTFGATLAEDEEPSQLVAFARILRHGTFAVYDAAGSIRLKDRRVSLMYPVVWTALQWARDTGAEWFDFGGITQGTADSPDDPLGGISEFKRNFGGEEIEVGEEWHLDVAPVRLRLVESVGRIRERLKGSP